MDRFWSKVDKGAECWLWTGALFRTGYGAFNLNGNAVRAHRLAYELTTGPIPAPLVLDHLCSVRRCVNPTHLEPVTRKENNRRGQTWRGGAKFQASKTHCPSGHEYTAANTYRDKNNWRQCRTCLGLRALTES